MSAMTEPRQAGSLWTCEEDVLLLRHVAKYGTKHWSYLQTSGCLPHRDQKACCNRFILLKRKFIQARAKGQRLSFPIAPQGDGRAVVPSLRPQLPAYVEPRLGVSGTSHAQFKDVGSSLSRRISWNPLEEEQSACSGNASRQGTVQQVPSMARPNRLVKADPSDEWDITSGCPDSVPRNPLTVDFNAWNYQDAVLGDELLAVEPKPATLALKAPMDMPSARAGS